ncbi:hypothetical protein [Shinella sp.]|uniref:hypothetical protein n=1 Tax=Shinella sp. TaxID=1870904 RepID=UPI003F6EA209
MFIPLEGGLSDLEPMLCDLAIVAGLARYITQGILDRPTLEDAIGTHFVLSDDERERVFFLVGEVEQRARDAKSAYYGALEAGTTR